MIASVPLRRSSRVKDGSLKQKPCKLNEIIRERRKVKKIKKRIKKRILTRVGTN
jgi:hypothetical protein